MTKPKKTAGQTVELEQLAAGLSNLEKNTAKMAQQKNNLPAPKFDGTSDVVQFIQKFEAVADFNGWEDMERQLRFQLAIEGTASQGLLGSTYEEMCKELKARYQLSEGGAAAMLKALRWKPNESIHEFSVHVRKLVDVAYPELDQNQKEARAIKELVTALPSNYNTLSWELNSRPPHSFADAVETIKNYCELNHTSSRINRLGEEDPLRKIVEAQAASIEKLVAAQAELSQQMSKLMAAQSSKPRSNKCFKCEKEGHFARNCPQQVQGNVQVRQE